MEETATFSFEGHKAHVSFTRNNRGARTHSGTSKQREEKGRKENTLIAEGWPTGTEGTDRSTSCDSI